MSLPKFEHLKSDRLMALIEEHLTTSSEHLDKITNTPIDEINWSVAITQWDEAESNFEIDWSAISHLDAVCYDEVFHHAYVEAEARVTEFYTNLAQNKALYERIKHLHSAETDVTKKRYLQKSIDGFERSGVHLPDAERKQVKEILLKLSEISTQFSSNIVTSTQAWSYHTEDTAEIEGIPPSIVRMLEQWAKAEDKSGYLFKLEAPVYVSVMQYAKSRKLRERLLKAWNTRASEKFDADPSKDNTALIQQTLALRHQLAALLGFENYAQYSIDKKMAPSTSEVIDFLNNMAKKVQPQAQSELKEIEERAKQDGIDALQPWDISYYSERIKEERYEFSDEDLKPYFEFHTVIKGMFSVVGEVIGFEVKPIEMEDKYHPDVTAYAVTRNDEIRGYVIADPFSRGNKRPGAWMADAVQRMRTNTGLQAPVAYLTCNATPSADGEPILISHDDVVTLFHEFGHTIHHLMSLVDIPGMSGIAGVEWDAVELPSQFLEHWCWQAESLAKFAKHHQTGESLPDELLQKALAAKNHHSGLMLLRQLEFAMTDMVLHAEETASNDPYAVAKRVNQQIAVAPSLDDSRMLCSFSHLFAGGYAAGYYSYLWAEVLSSDAFSMFEEEGIFSQTAGAAFRENILEVGSTRPAMESYIEFRGRAPNDEALLRHRGVA
ncbi:MAG: M3 family metallopeptidase [Gammaproteobacteria bacterium]|nr:M3 family metallopeptidase [Gammaproteobacteria bacterium]